jgi:hypothetical protein
LPNEAPRNNEYIGLSIRLWVSVLCYNRQSIGRLQQDLATTLTQEDWCRGHSTDTAKPLIKNKYALGWGKNGFALVYLGWVEEVTE